MQGYREDRRVRLQPRDDGRDAGRGGGRGGAHDGRRREDAYGGRAGADAYDDRDHRGSHRGSGRMADKGQGRANRDPYEEPPPPRTRGRYPDPAAEDMVDHRRRRAGAPRQERVEEVHSEECLSGSEEEVARDPRRGVRQGAAEGRGGRDAGREAKAPKAWGDEMSDRLDRLVKAQPSVSSKREAPAPEEPAPLARPARASAAPSDPPPRSAVPLVVSGCTNATISAIVKGNYTPYSQNHGKVVYRKDEKSKGFEVLIYYWDDRDGAELCGWWFGPNVGGDQVWAYHPSRSSTSPPSSEWNVPHDGPIDPSFSVTARLDVARTRHEKAPEPAVDSMEKPALARRGAAAEDRASGRSGVQASTPGRPEHERSRLDGGSRQRDYGDSFESRRTDPYDLPRREDRTELQRDGGRDATASRGSTHQYFVEAYQKRRQMAEEERKQADDPKDPLKDARREREEEARREERRRREEEMQRQILEKGPRMDRTEDRRRGESPRALERRRAPLEDDRNDPLRRREDRLDERRDDRRDGRPEDRRDDRRDERLDRRDGRDLRDDPLRRDSARDEPRRDGPRDDAANRARIREEERRREDERRRKQESDRRAAEEQRREDERRRVRDQREREEERRREDERRHREEARRRDEDNRRRNEVSEVDRERLEIERKKKEEDMKRKDEELQKKREERRREEEEKRKQLEEERREENAKRRAEEKERAEREKQERTEREAAEAEAERQRKDEETRALRQQQATLNVLQVLQKLSSATPDNFDALKLDLDAALVTELPECGQQQEILKAEADRVLEYAQQYVKQVTDQRQQEETKRIEQEKTAKELLVELDKLVTAAEEHSEIVYTTAAPLGEADKLSDEDIVKVSRSVQKLGRAAMAACSNCADFITHKRPIIEEAESITEESSAAIAVLLPRIRAATRRTAEAFQQGKEYKDKIEKKLCASRYSTRQDGVFKKYDSDGDGFLTIADIQSYAKGEFGFEIPADNVARIEKLVKLGNPGLPREDFQRLKAAVGIARSEVLGQQQRAERIERQAKEKEEAEQRKVRLEQRRTELQDLLKENAKALTRLEPMIRQSEAIAEALAGEAGQLGSQELKEKADKVDSHTQETKAKLDEVRGNIQAIQAEITEEKELQDWMRGILVPLSSRSDIFDLRLKKAIETASSGRQLAQYMALSEYEGLWTEIVVKLRACIESHQGKSVENLFDVITGSDITPPDSPESDMETVTTSEIQTFLVRHGCEVEIEKLDKLFGRTHAKNNKGATDVQTTTPAITDGESKAAETTTQATDEPKEEDNKKETKENEAAESNDKDGSKDVEMKDANTNADAAEKEGNATATSDETKGDTSEAVDSSTVANGATETKDSTDDTKENEKPEDNDRKDTDKTEEGTEKNDKEPEKEKDVANDTLQAEAAAAMAAIAQADAEETGAPERAENQAVTEKDKEPEKKEGEQKLDVLSLDIMAAASKAAEQLHLARGGFHITRKDFKQIIRMYYKVVRHCVLSDNLQIEQSAQIRRMDVGEVIEVHRGPSLDSSVNVYRVFGRCIRDGINGWATIAGNTGVTFLMPGGRIFTVKVQVPLTQDLKDVEGVNTVRMLGEGEVLEVLEWARTSRSALGVTRIRVMAQLDSAVGWATTVGNDQGNTVYLEAM